MIEVLLELWARITEPSVRTTSTVAASGLSAYWVPLTWVPEVWAPVAAVLQAVCLVGTTIVIVCTARKAIHKWRDD